MNIKLLFKTILILAVLALLVIMGMHNKSMIELDLPPILPNTLKQPAAYMYFSFFAVGFIVGALVMAGGGKKGSGKPSKEK
jgi:uncharacterized integral membrane protein